LKRITLGLKERGKDHRGVKGPKVGRNRRSEKPKSDVEEKKGWENKEEEMPEEKGKKKRKGSEGSRKGFRKKNEGKIL